jgi:hypothetical protein
VKESVRQLEIVDDMLVKDAAVMGIALLVLRFVTGSFGVKITNALPPVTEVLVLLVQ